MRVQHNIGAMNANRQLQITGRSIVKSARNLSSGYRVNIAADDAAGLAISEKMRRQVRGLTQGVQNTEDGVSLCQVADGALAEVNEMLQRINELAIQAANGTNSETDRKCINDEVSRLITEIDRIGETTKFNEIYIFQGTEKKTVTETVVEEAKPPPSGGGVGPTPPGGGVVPTLPEGAVPAPPFEEISMDCELTDGPFGEYDQGGHLALRARSTSANMMWQLIYNDGIGTSQPKLVGSYTPAAGTPTAIAFEIDLKNKTPSEYNAGQNGNGEKEWSRVFSYDDPNGLGMKIKQTVTLHKKDEAAGNQYYTVSYNVSNTSSTGSVKYNLVHHEDTAYGGHENENDECYYAGGAAISKSTIYTTNTTISGGLTHDVQTTVPGTFTVALDKNDDGVADALSFTESIKISGVAAGDVSADTLIVGVFSEIGDIEHDKGYTEGTVGGILGKTLGSYPNTDLGFSLIWSDQTLAAGASSATYSFKQGIVKTENDANVPPGVQKIPTVTPPTVTSPPVNPPPADPPPVTPPTTVTTIRVKKTYMGGERQIWIQSGCDTGDGIILRTGAMNTGVLDIDDLSTLTEKSSNDAIGRVSKALAEISRQRSRFGAYQNRLEHTIANEENIVENTAAAESQIRDTDMADEMVRYSNKNIIMQAGQSMLAQANQTKQGVLSLLAS